MYEKNQSNINIRKFKLKNLSKVLLHLIDVYNL